MKLPIRDIKPNPNNPRQIKDDKFKKLVQSLKDFPEMAEVREIVINKDNVILGGNMRYKAMQEAGWTEVPVRVVDWPEDKQREFIIKDNVSGGEWDWDVLANEWDAELLDDWGLDLPTLFGEEEVEEDEAPEVSSDPPVSKLGEIYQLGRHRVMCGNSLNDMGVLMGEVKADMVFTDPPYNVDYVGGNHAEFDRPRTKTIQNDKKSDDEFFNFLVEAFGALSGVTKSGGAYYICHSDQHGHHFRNALLGTGFLIKQCIIWNKNGMVMGRQDYHWKHEPILYGWLEGGSHKFYGERNQTTVWDIDRPNRSDEHPTMKPIALIARAINNSSKTDDIILDNFLGSGSTLIACEQTDRTCYGMEIDPKYCDVIRKRYAKFIGEDELWVENTPVIKQELSE